MIIIPEGVLADAPLPDKLIALACGFVMFFASRRSTTWATATAFVVFAAIALWRTS